MEKSYVCIQTMLCPICLAEVGEQILLNKQLEKTLENHSVIGKELCKSCKSRREEYIAIIEATGKKETDRTGRVLHVRRTALKQMLKNPNDEILNHDAVVMPPAVVEELFGEAIREFPNTISESTTDKK